MKNYFTILLLSLFFASAVGQQSKIDSLNKALLNAKTEYDKIDAISGLARVLVLTENEKAKKIADSSLNWSIKLQYQIGIAYSYIALGSYYYMASNFDSAIVYYNKALPILIKNEENQKKNIGIINNNLSLIYTFKGNYKKSLDHNRNSLAIFRSLAARHQIASTFANMANNYSHLNMLDSSMFFHFEALRIYELLGDSITIADELHNVSNILYRQKQFTKALEFSEKSLSIAKNMNYFTGMADALGTQADIQSRTNKNLALQLSLQSLDYYQKSKDSWGMAILKLKIGTFYIELDDYKNANSYLLQSIKISKQNGFDSHLCKAYRRLAECYNKQNNSSIAILYCDSALVINDVVKNVAEQYWIIYEKALAYSKNGSYEKANNNLLNCLELKDSINDLNNFEASRELQTKYETEKKDLENKALQAKTQLLQARQNITIIGFITGIIILALISFIIIRKKQMSAKIKQQLARDKAREIERNKIASDLHDNVASSLSFAFNNIKVKAENNEPFEQELKDAEEVKELIRTISHRLRKPDFENVDFVAHLNQTISTINKGDKLMVEFKNSIADWTAIPKPLQQELLYISKELLNNTQKYAHANKVNISVSIVKKQIEFYYDDNGKGFDKLLLAKNMGMGIQSITARVKALGGTVLFEPVINEGLAVTINAPLLKKYDDLLL